MISFRFGGACLADAALLFSQSTPQRTGNADKAVTCRI
jgi:hypothetical protein